MPARTRQSDEEELERRPPEPTPPHSEEEIDPASRAHLTPGQFLALQRRAGNRAARAYLLRDEGGHAAVAEPEQEAATAPQVAPDEPKAEPEHPAPPKLQLDLASGEKVLTNAFGAVKKIVQGKIEVLDPAKFQEAYDKIYGQTQWSWDKYVKPTYGSLNGFAYDGVNYINTGSAGLHTVVHEMLHNNTAVDWRGVVGSRFDEGTTEVLTQEACKKLQVDAPTCYPGESPVVRALLATGLSLDVLVEAYLVGGAKAKIADWVDKNCAEPFAKVVEYMEAKNWAAATLAVGRKK
jgi:hypothetical protein